MFPLLDPDDTPTIEVFEATDTMSKLNHLILEFPSLLDHMKLSLGGKDLAIPEGVKK